MYLSTGFGGSEGVSNVVVESSLEHLKGILVYFLLLLWTQIKYLPSPIVRPYSVIPDDDDDDVL